MNRATRPFTFALLGSLALTSATSAAEPPRPTFINNREVILTYQTTHNTTITDVNLWSSTDAGRTWQPAEFDRPHEHALKITVPDDGRYDFYLILRNAAGATGDAPVPGTRPTTSIIVDTTPPLIQVHAVALESINNNEAVVLTCTLVEENLRDQSLRLFYHHADTWHDGGPVTYADQRAIWFPPTNAPPVVDLRLIATDRAGNATDSIVEDVTLPIREPDPADLAPEKTDVAATKPNPNQPPLLVGPLTPPNVTPVKTPSLASLAAESATPKVSDATPDQSAQLRHAAARFMSQGRFSLAAARFREALTYAPQDPNLLVDLGSAEYRLHNYQQSAARFHAALDASPNHTGALEGLALVAATEKRYPDARTHLTRLLELQPESAVHWLRLGDIEHRLGDTHQALAAWQKTLKRTTDEELIKKAQRRLNYFGPDRFEDNNEPDNNAPPNPTADHRLPRQR